jgi:hypothetical protein
MHRTCRFGLALAGLAALLLAAACQTKINDDTKPQVSIVYPRSGETLVAGITRVKVLATDPVGIDSVLFYQGSHFIDKKIYGTADTFTGLWRAAIDTIPYGVVFKAIAFDQAGNRGDAQWVMTWVVPARQEGLGFESEPASRRSPVFARKGVSR